MDLHIFLISNLLQHFIHTAPIATCLSQLTPWTSSKALPYNCKLLFTMPITRLRALSMLPTSQNYRLFSANSHMNQVVTCSTNSVKPVVSTNLFYCTCKGWRLMTDVCLCFALKDQIKDFLQTVNSSDIPDNIWHEDVHGLIICILLWFE